MAVGRGYMQVIDGCYSLPSLAQRRRQFRVLTIALLALLAMQGFTRLNAQTSSVLEGTVVDPQGKMVAGAVIALTGQGLAGQVQLLSDPSGSYRLPGLAAGTVPNAISHAG